MSITAYVGLPGHGKSYGVVENVILPALENCRPVFTNIPLNDDLCMKKFGFCANHFDIADIIDNEHWWTEVFIPGSVLVLDEVWRLWPSGLRANLVRESDKSFLAEHRHMVGDNGLSTEVVLVTQDLGQIASFARVLVETTFRVVKHSAMGLKKAYRVDVFQGPVTGPAPPLSKRVREIHGRFKKDVFALYVSHTMSKTGESGDESRTDGRFNVLKKASIKIGFAVFVLCIFVMYFGFKSLATKYSSDEVVQVPEVESPRTADHSSDKPSLKITKPRFLSLAKSIYFSGREVVMLQDRVEKRFYFDVEFEDNQIFMSDKDLHRMGYELKFASDDVVLLTGYDINRFVTFRKRSSDDSGDKSVLAKVVNPIVKS